MSRYFFYIAGIVSLLTGCTKKTDLVFDETPDERINKAILNYQTSLLGAPGWKLFVYPKGLEGQGIEVGGLSYYLRFTDTNRVSMISDFALTTAGEPNESGFRIKAAQRPSLVFDTYSYIHLAADPDETVSFSPTETGGFGWGTDFDFSFTALDVTDTIPLKGNFNESDAVLIKATEQEIADAFAGRLEVILAATADFSNTNPFLYFPAADNAEIGVSFNLFLYRINFSYLSGTQLATISAPFSHTTYGLHFKDPITVGGYTFQDLYWDEAQQRYYLNTPGGRRDITNSNAPLFPFYSVLGRSVTTISVPATTLPGSSVSFDEVHETIEAGLINSPYTLLLGRMDFIFDAESGTMALLVHVTQSGNPFVLQYVYNYSMNTANEVDFVFAGMNGNAGLVQNEMAPFLDYISDDEFKLDYFTGSSPVTGQFTSLDSPGFFFTGNLQ